MPARKTLVVLVPNYWGDPASLEPLKNAIESDAGFAAFEWLPFAYKEPFWSNKSLETVAQNLADTIDSHVHLVGSEAIERIILLGHSMGSVVLRRALLNASGFGAQPGMTQAWARLVERLILIGAFGRGLDPDRLPLATRTYLKPIIALGSLMRIGLMRRDILAGSDFISRLRVDWITYNKTPDIESRQVVMHLLGSDDAFIKREDVIDLEQFPNATHIGIPNATHGDVIEPRPETINQLKRAFVEQPAANRGKADGKKAQKIIFLLHGIRDSRDCFKRVAECLGNLKQDIKVVVPSYGYLSALGFVSTSNRNRYVPWFVDQYSEQLAQNPSAEFFFAGHSNGTYILGESLYRIPRMRFARIYIAASVLPAEYAWDKVIIDRGQTDFVRSDMGSEDVPVGVLCRVLNRFGMDSIGPGGFDGFEFGDHDHIAYNRFAGGHDAMLTKDNAESIARFLVDGLPLVADEAEPPKAAWRFNLLRKYGDILLPALLFLLLAGLITLAAAPWLCPTSRLCLAPWLTIAGPWSALLLILTLWIVSKRF